MKRPWFKNKTYGYGWFPATWEGWLITVGFLIAIIGNSLTIKNSEQALTVFLPETVLMVILLLVITYLTGEKPRWIWGGRMTVIYTVFGSPKEADQISEILLEEKLIACANTWKISSQYHWKGQIEHSEEVAAFLKTTNWNYSKAVDRLKTLHSYETPAIIKLSGNANTAYFNWLRSETKP